MTKRTTAIIANAVVLQGRAEGRARHGHPRWVDKLARYYRKS